MSLRQAPRPKKSASREYKAAKLLHWGSSTTRQAPCRPSGPQRVQESCSHIQCLCVRVAPSLPAQGLPPGCLCSVKFTLAREIPGIDGVALTYVQERISVRGGDVDILGIEDGPTPLLVILEQGDDVRAVLVRVVKTGKKIRY